MDQAFFSSPMTRQTCFQKGINPPLCSAIYVSHDMNKRPLSVSIISWLFIAAGSVGLAYHLTEFRTGGLFQFDLAAVCFVRLLAIFSGVFMLRGCNWARWLLLVWIAYHVILSAFHSFFEALIHGLLLALIAYFLLRAGASAYFRNANPKP